MFFQSARVFAYAPLASGLLILDILVLWLSVLYRVCETSKCGSPENSYSERFSCNTCTPPYQHWACCERKGGLKYTIAAPFQSRHLNNRPVHVPDVPGEGVPRQLLEAVRADFLYPFPLRLCAATIRFFRISS